MTISKVVVGFEQTPVVQDESSLAADQLHVCRKWRQAEIDLSQHAMKKKNENKNRKKIFT